jgi:hypothetical protein
VIMGANIAGIYGAQIFREDDRPRYRRGFSINIAVLTVGLSLAAFRYVDDLLRRRRNARQMQNESASERNSHDEGKLKAARLSDIEVEPQTILIGGDIRPVAAR